jgi:hypothetical protein
MCNFIANEKIQRLVAAVAFNFEFRSCFRLVVDCFLVVPAVNESKVFLFYFVTLLVLVHFKPLDFLLLFWLWHVPFWGFRLYSAVFDRLLHDCKCLYVDILKLFEHVNSNFRPFFCYERDFGLILVNLFYVPWFDLSDRRLIG